MSMLGRYCKDDIQNGKPLITRPKGIGSREAVEESLVLRAEEWFADDGKERVYRVQIIVEKPISQMSRGHVVSFHWFRDGDVEVVQVVV
jgi:hypothetical protein